MCLCLSIETNSKRKDTHSVGSDFSKESICSTSAGAGQLHRNLDCIYIYTRKYRPQPETQHSSQHFIQRLESTYLFLFWGSHPICSYERWKLHHRALGLHGLVYRLVQEQQLPQVCDQVQDPIFLNLGLLQEFHFLLHDLVSHPILKKGYGQGS